MTLCLATGCGMPSEIHDLPSISCTKTGTLPMPVLPAVHQMPGWGEQPASAFGSMRSAGCLLAEGHAGLLEDDGTRRGDFALSDVLGIGFTGYSGALEGNYVQVEVDWLRRDLPSYPIHIIGQAISVELRAQTVGRRFCPHWVVSNRYSAILLRCTTHPHVCRFHQRSPIIALGEGRAVYFASSIGNHITRRRNVDPWTKRLVAGTSRVSADPVQAFHNRRSRWRGDSAEQAG